MKYDTYDFGCLYCGNITPLQRKMSLKHNKFHRKKLYCYNCKNTVNHIECKTDKEREEFLLNFSMGEYVEEAQTSIENIKTEDIWKALEV